MMTTELEIHDAIIIPPTTPIRFDVARADIETMKTEAARLRIDGPDDRAGFDAVYRFRQLVKRQRVSVEKKGKELKAPHIAYNRSVDEAMKELTRDMESVEDALAGKEKAYNDERERIADEMAKALRLRTHGRTTQLQAWGFRYNVTLDVYEFEDVIINVDDVRGLPEDEYELIRYHAEYSYRLAQDRLAEIEAERKAEAARIEAEREAFIAEKKAIEAERLALREKEVEADRIIREQYDRESAEHMKQDKAAALALEEADYVRREKQQETEQKAQRKADRERQNRLKPEKKDFAMYLKTCFPMGDALGYGQPEVVELVSQFNQRMQDVVKEFRELVDAL